MLRNFGQPPSKTDGKMEVIRELEDKYGSLPSVNQLEDMEHWIGALDRFNAWSVARVLRVEFDELAATYTFDVDWPNWAGEPITTIIQSTVEPESHDVTDVKIDSISNCILETGALFRNVPLRHEPHSILFGTPNNQRSTRVTCYMSNIEESCKKKHVWTAGVMYSDGTVKTVTGKGPRRKNVVFKPDTVWITAPVGSRRRKTPMLAQIFAKLNELIFATAVEDRDHLRKTNRKRRREISRGSQVVLNELTLKFLKRKPRHVSKTCMAYKKGWINKFGKPITWGCHNGHKKRSIENGFPVEIIRHIFGWVGGQDLCNWVCVDRKTNFDLVDHKFLSDQYASICTHEHALQTHAGHLKKSLSAHCSERFTVAESAGLWKAQNAVPTPIFFERITKHLVKIEAAIVKVRTRCAIVDPMVARTREKKKAIEMYI